MNTIQICFTVPNNLTLEDTIAWKCFKKLPFDIPWVLAKNASIVHGRNACILGTAKAVKHPEVKFSSYLFIDSDIAFGLQDIERIILASGKYDIISGLYQSRTSLHKGCAGWVDKDFHFKNEDIAFLSKGIHQVDWCGAGFLLINKSVLDRLEYPWFRNTILEYEDTITMLSEDLSLCKSLKDNNIPLYINCDIKVVHLT